MYEMAMETAGVTAPSKVRLKRCRLWVEVSDVWSGREQRRGAEGEEHSRGAEGEEHSSNLTKGARRLTTGM